MLWDTGRKSVTHQPDQLHPFKIMGIVSRAGGNVNENRRSGGRNAIRRKKMRRGGFSPRFRQKFAAQARKALTVGGMG